MNKSFSETAEFLEKLWLLYKKNKKEIYPNIIFGIAPSFINIPAFKLNRIKELKVGAQNISHFSKNSRTGEVSGIMLKDLDVEYVIVGHSERRLYCNENNKVVNEKIKKAIENGIVPILCVGENSNEFQQNKTKEVIKKQIEESLEGIDSKNIIITYEPEWAIGTGEAATSDNVEEIAKFIHSIVGNDTKLLYGGSVCPENVAELFKLEDIDGFLVGKASLDPEKFMKILSLKK